MQVKVCPKCGAENRPDKAACSGCYSSLEGVPETEGKPKPASTGPAAERPTTEGPPAAQPLGGIGSPAPNPNYAPPGGPSTYRPPTFNERSQPIKQGPNWGAIVLVVLLIAGAAFAGWWFFLKPAGPEKVVQQMIDASKAGDYEKMKACFSQSTINMIQMTPGGEEAAKQSLQGKSSRQYDGKITGVTYDDKNSSLAYVALEPANKAQLPPGMTSVEVVCSKENGQWKVDLMGTTMRMMRKMFPNGVPGMGRPR